MPYVQRREVAEPFRKYVPKPWSELGQEEARVRATDFSRKIEATCPKDTGSLREQHRGHVGGERVGKDCCKGASGGPRAATLDTAACVSGKKGP